MIDLPVFPSDDFESLHARLAALEQREQWLSIAIAALDVGLWWWDVRQGTIQLHPVWTDMLGLDPIDPPQPLSVYLKFVHPDDRDRVARRMEQFAAGTGERWTSHHRLLHRDGTPRKILSRGSVANATAEGRPGLVVGGDIDVTGGRSDE